MLLHFSCVSSNKQIYIVHCSSLAKMTCSLKNKRKVLAHVVKHKRLTLSKKWKIVLSANVAQIIDFLLKTTMIKISIKASLLQDRETLMSMHRSIKEHFKKVETKQSTKNLLKKVLRQNNWRVRILRSEKSLRLQLT